MNRNEVAIGTTKTKTVTNEIIKSNRSLSINLNATLSCKKCAGNESNNFNPKIPITTKAAVSNNEYF